MSQTGKIQCAIKEMERMNISIMGISEMRWPDASYCDIERHRVYFSGSTNGKLEYGVGIIVHKDIVKHVSNFVPVNDRIMLLQINSSPVNTNIIQAYAPTTDHSDEEVQLMYDQIQNILKKLPKHELNIVMGDFNAKVGKGRDGTHIGSHGLGERNDRGDILSTFAAENNLIILNTFFQLPNRRLYTWTSPRDNGRDIWIRNQIDYIMVNQRYRNSFTSVKTYPGADIKSDHNPLVGEYRIKFKKILKKDTPRHNIRLLKSRLVKNQVSKALNDKCRQLKIEGKNTEDAIQELNAEVENLKNTHLKQQNNKDKSWMTEEIKHLMEERRIHKNNQPIYREKDRELQRKIREAKQKEIDEKCRDIEILQERYDEFNVHKKVREITGRFKKKVVGKLLNDKGELLVDKDDIKTTWKSYIENLFLDERGNPPILEVESGPNILPEEVTAAIKALRDGKVPGPDGIQAEFLKLLDEMSIKILCNIFNEIYNSGNIPKEWLVSEFIMLPKKQGAKTCGEYRTISLMSHLLKLFLKIIHRRIFKLCEERVANTQFGFMKGVGTRDALFSLQVLFQRCRDVNCDIYACFVDYQKAFDRIRHEKMIEILKTIGMDGKDLRIIRNLYWNQTATIKLSNEDKTEEVNILRGVRQGCIISPLLFNLYSEEIFKEALYEGDEGILLNGERLNNIRYADDTVIFADSLEGLQSLITKVNTVSENYGLQMNIAKTKFMIISKTLIANCQLLIKDTPVEREFIYSRIYLPGNSHQRSMGPFTRD
uniref:Craniofacial development protein 2 n=1 Tax=Cacopsylla melanoneura TaxID=428564 RepID=A0A8D8Q762_9HEMI